MKKISLLVCTCIFLFASCQTTKPAAEPVKPVEPEIPAPAPEPVPEEKQAQADDEYLRSVNSMDISKDTFAEDKRQIMEIISGLSEIMQNYNYDGWISYIDEESKVYWSNPNNLRKASKLLPVKGLKLNNLNDYFLYVFCPSRKGRSVDEIRYISKTNVKAVQVQEDTDVIYYYFQKYDGKWLVHLPPLSN
jgi:hypothetical protein